MDKTKRKQAKSDRRIKKIYAKERRLRDAWSTFLYGSIGHMACGRKQRYSSLEDAKHIIIRSHIRQTDSQTNSVYKCPFCQGWHLTHYEDTPTALWTNYTKKAFDHRDQIVRLTPSEKMVPLQYAHTGIQEQTIQQIKDRTEQKYRSTKHNIIQTKQKIQTKEIREEIQTEIEHRITAKKEAKQTPQIPKQPPIKQQKTYICTLKKKKKGTRH